MTATIIKLKPMTARTPDQVLELAAGQFQNVVVIGYDHDGNLDCLADQETSRKEILWLIEQFKLFLLTGGGDDE